MQILSHDEQKRAGEIAEVMVSRTSLAGCCTEADLRQRGFSERELTSLGNEAKRLATAATKVRPGRLTVDRQAA